MSAGALRQKVMDELRWDPRMKSRNIRVDAFGNSILLTGEVSSFAEHWSVERAAARVSVDREIVNRLRIRVPSELTKTDAELYWRVVESFRWDARLVETEISVEVVDSWVTLRGRVEWPSQKSAATQAVCNNISIRGLTNEIVVGDPALAHLVGDLPDEVEDFSLHTVLR